MRKKTFLLLLALPVLMTSCIVGSYHHTTGNAIGTKEGYAKFRVRKWIKGDIDAGIAAAAKKGGITKIGSVDTYSYMWFFGVNAAVRVTGE